MANLNVAATMVAKKGKEKELEAQLRGLVGPSRKDQGCLSYDLHQSLDDPAVFFFYETWESKAALDQHMAAPHFTAYREKSKDLVESMEVKLLKKLS
jgi:quinol monooxygenase YgiN